MTLFVSLYGGPGSGKSTTAAAVFAALKRRNVNCELVTEFAKDKVWEGHKKVFEDQLYIFGKQHWKFYRLQGEVDIVITDSPLILTVVYNEIYSKYTSLEAMVMEAYGRFDNLNYFLERSKVYNPKGRNQTEDEAKGIDVRTRQTLERLGIPFVSVDYRDAEARIVADVLLKLRMEE